MQNALVDKAEKEFFGRIQSLLTSDPLPLTKHFEKICGVDAAYSVKENRVVASAVLFAEGVLSETSIYSGNFTFPYVSGLFFLHEGPFVVAAVEKLSKKPELVCFDGHGIAHPRSKGLATICGMVLRIPSIGIAKRAFVGRTLRYMRGLEKLHYNGKDVGFVSTQNKKRFWSPGYSVSLSDLEEIIFEHGETCVQAINQAHELSRKSIISLPT